MNTVEVENLKIYYKTESGDVKAVDDVTFNLAKGESLGIVGESGCGKTTLAYSLLKMVSPPGEIVDGKIIISGVEIQNRSEKEIRRDVRWKKISMVFQGAMNSLNPVFKIGKQMMETIRIHKKVDKKEAKEQIIKYLKQVGLGEDIFKRYPHELSGGQKQRVAIAMALFLEPDVVICDEPTTALDVIVQAQILNLIKELRKELGLSFIFISHDLATVAEISERVMIMYAGKVVEIGGNETIYHGERRHPYTDKLLKAIPNLSSSEKPEYIDGSLPDLINSPKGCRFYDRCHLRGEECMVEPVLREVEKEHFVACWKVRKVES